MRMYKCSFVKMYKNGKAVETYKWRFYAPVRGSGCLASFFGTTSRGTTYDSVRDVLRSTKFTLAKTVSSATWPLKTPRKVNTLSGKVAYGLIWAYPGSSGSVWIYLNLLGPSGAFNHPGGCYTMYKCSFVKMYKTERNASWNVSLCEMEKICRNLEMKILCASAWVRLSGVFLWDHLKRVKMQ